MKPFSLFGKLSFLVVICFALLGGCNQDPPPAKKSENTTQTLPSAKTAAPQQVAESIRDKTLKLYMAIQRAEEDKVQTTKSGVTLDLAGLVVIPNYISVDDYTPPSEVKGSVWYYYKESYRLLIQGNELGSFTNDDFFVLEMKQDSFSKKVCLALNALEGSKSKNGELPVFNADISSLDIKEESGQGCGIQNDKYVYYRILQIR